MKPRVFVSSSKESLPLARAVHGNLDHDVEVTPWAQNFFTLSRPYLESLVGRLGEFDFGVFVFSPDDVLQIRGKEHGAVRDNVIFEFGMFVGRLGVERTFFMIPRGREDLHLPSDILGIVPCTYNPGRTDGDLRAAVDPACNDILSAIKKLGPVRREPPAPDPSPQERGTDLDENDVKAHLGAWIASHGNSLERRAIVFAKIDRELGFSPGTTARYIHLIAGEYSYTMAYCGGTTALLRRQRSANGAPS